MSGAASTLGAAPFRFKESYEKSTFHVIQMRGACFCIIGNGTNLPAMS